MIFITKKAFQEAIIFGLCQIATSTIVCKQSPSPANYHFQTIIYKALFTQALERARKG
jgi:hypothetical protein